jgi:hypothetical protein
VKVEVNGEGLFIQREVDPDFFDTEMRYACAEAVRWIEKYTAKPKEEA